MFHFHFLIANIAFSRMKTTLLIAEVCQNILQCESSLARVVAMRNPSSKLDGATLLFSELKFADKTKSRGLSCERCCCCWRRCCRRRSCWCWRRSCRHCCCSWRWCPRERHLLPKTSAMKLVKLVSTDTWNGDAARVVGMWNGGHWDPRCEIGNRRCFQNWYDAKWRSCQGCYNVKRRPHSGSDLQFRRI